MKFLLVEDHAPTRRAIAKSIRTIDPTADIVEQSDGTAAEALLQKASFDCVLLDYQLPGKNGLEILRAVREAGITTPIILITAQGDELLAVEAMKAGASDYLPKSHLSLDNLRRCVLGAVRLHRAEVEAASARRELREHQEQLARVLETNVDGIIILDRQGRFRFINPAAERILGLTHEQATAHSGGYAQPPWTRADPDGQSMPEQERPVWRVLQSGQPLYGSEVLVTHPDGTQMVLSANIAPLKEPDGSVSGVVASVRDITAQRRAEHALRLSEGQLRLFVEHTPAAIAMFDRDMRYLLASRRWLSDYRLGNQSIIGRSHYEVFPDLPPRWREVHRRCLAGTVEKCEADRWDRADGSVDWVHWEVHPWRNNQGNIGGLIIFTEVITERKRVEQAQYESETKYRSLAEHSAVGICHANMDGQILYANQTMRRMLEIDSEAELNRHINSFFAGDSLQTFLRERTKRHLGLASTYELELIGKHGTRRQLVVSGAPLFGPDGKVHSSIATFTDITERVRAEEKLREAEVRYRSLFEQSPHGVFIIEPDRQQISEYNSAACRMLGYTTKELSALHISDYEVFESPEETQERVRKILRTGADEFETKLRTKTGEIRDALVSVRRLTMGGRTLLLTILQDITERNRLKEELLQSQKMEAIGRLAGGVAHDFNNLLAVISGYSESLLRRLTRSSPLRMHAEEIRKAAERGGSLTRQLLAFSRRQIIQPQRLDLNRLVAEVHEMLRRVIGKLVCMVVQPASNLHLVEADPGQMSQVIMNLALNARDAMPAGGTLTIQTANICLSASQAALHGLREGPYVNLSVTDTGVGMDAQTRQRIFEPFFTTKEGQGTGLGLSIVYSIVQQYRGGITIDSEPAKGSRFDILLPAANPSAQEPGA